MCLCSVRLKGVEAAFTGDHGSSCVPVVFGYLPFADKVSSKYTPFVAW
jgi:hypothetical protein